MTYPYSDDYMIYDYNAHMYYLTPKAVMDIVGENLDTRLNTYGDTNTSTIAERFCRESAESLYDYIRDTCLSYSVMEFIMACDGRMRDKVKEMLVAIMRYHLKNGKIEEFNGMNVQKGTAMRVEDLRGDLDVPKRVVSMTHEIMPTYGFCLCSRRNVGKMVVGSYERYNY